MKLGKGGQVTVCFRNLDGKSHPWSKTMDYIRIAQRIAISVGLYFGLYILLMDRNVAAVDDMGKPKYSCASRFFGGGIPMVVDGATHGLRRATFLNSLFYPAEKIDRFICGSNGVP